MDVLFTISHRGDFDPIGLAKVLKDARKEKRMSVREVADALAVPVTEAEHWFRTDRYLGKVSPLSGIRRIAADPHYKGEAVIGADG